MATANTVVTWLLKVHYGNNLHVASNRCGYSVQQLEQWRSGKRIPRSQTVLRLMHHTFEPAFTIIAEFQRLRHNDTIEGVHGQLKVILKGFEKSSGI